MKRLATLAVIGGLLSACASAGPYSYSRSYEVLDDEEVAISGAKEYDPVMASRSPDAWRGKDVTLFGVVKARHNGPNGTADVTLSVRTLEARNLCETPDESTCRVTVSDREHGVVHALLRLRPADAIGEKSVGVGSLVRAVGPVADAAATDGHVIVRAAYYRHFPRNTFVTTSARSYMLQ